MTNPRPASPRPLTPRQLEILALLAAGRTTPEIAAALGIKPSTVKTHLTGIYLKTGSRNRVEAVRHFLAGGNRYS